MLKNCKRKSENKFELVLFIFIFARIKQNLPNFQF